MYLDFLIVGGVQIVIKLGAVAMSAPFFIVPGILMGVAGAQIGQIYMKAQLSVKREKSNARSPVLGHFGAAFAGLGMYACVAPVRKVLNTFVVSIRAYGVQDAFRKESYVRINKYTRAARIFWALSQYVTLVHHSVD